MIFEEAIDRGLEVGNGSEDAAFEAALCEGGEEALDGIKPGGRCRREMEVQRGWRVSHRTARCLWKA